MTKQQLIDLVKKLPVQIGETTYSRSFCERVQKQQLTTEISIGSEYDDECEIYHSNHPTVSFSFKTERGMKIAIGKMVKMG
tara:strand:- start:370 stop:612 length:243 start_codon:yes stop_codon:yes gene_type:complete